MSWGQHAWLLTAIIGLCAVTVVTRSFFLLTPSRFEFSRGIQRALRYAPPVAIMMRLLLRSLRNGSSPVSRTAKANTGRLNTTPALDMVHGIGRNSSTANPR